MSRQFICPRRGNCIVILTSTGNAPNGVLPISPPLGQTVPAWLPEAKDHVSPNSNMAVCNLMCVNTVTGSHNCGSCGNQIVSGQTCCSGKAVNTMTDPSNCGACGAVVPSGQNCCSGKALNTLSDAQNCGSCNHACATNNKCSSGACTPTNCQGRGPIPRCSVLQCPDAAPGTFCNCVEKVNGMNICQSGWTGFCYQSCTEDSDCVGFGNPSAICARASCCPTVNGNDFFCTLPSGNAQCSNPARRLGRVRKRDATVTTEIRDGELVSVLEA